MGTSNGYGATLLFWCRSHLTSFLEQEPLLTPYHQANLDAEDAFYTDPAIKALMFLPLLPALRALLSLLTSNRVLAKGPPRTRSKPLSGVSALDSISWTSRRLERADEQSSTPNVNRSLSLRRRLSPRKVGGERCGQVATGRRRPSYSPGLAPSDGS